MLVGVYDYAKILIFQQITTPHTKSMAQMMGVYDYAKILIFQQITT